LSICIFKHFMKISNKRFLYWASLAAWKSIACSKCALEMSWVKTKVSELWTLTCVLVARPRRCLTLSNPVPWQNWMAAYLGYTLRMKTLFHGWPVMAYETHTRRRSELWHVTVVWAWSIRGSQLCRTARDRILTSHSRPIVIRPVTLQVNAWLSNSGHATVKATITCSK